MKSSFHVANVVIAFLAATGLTGCGGGGSGPADTAIAAAPPGTLPLAPPSPPPSPAPTSASPYFLASGVAGPLVQGPVTDAQSGFRFQSGHLVVVDPASPTTPVALEAGGEWQPLAEFKEGVVDAAAGTIGNLSTRFLAYFKAGRIHRLDLRHGSWPPAPALVSSLPTSEICGFAARAIHDWQAPERSWLLFAARGPDRSCITPNVRQVAVRLDMSEADPPVQIDAQIVGTLRTSAGAITGFAVRSGNRIRKVDASFANPVELFTIASALSTYFLLRDPDTPSSMPRGLLLFVEANQLRAFNADSGNGPVTVYSPAPGEDCCRVVDADPSAVYLFANGSDTLRLMRVTGAPAADVLASEPARLVYGAVSTPTRLVYSITDASGVLYRSVPKTGGTPITIAPVVPCPDLSSAFASGENIWYDCSGLGPWDYGGFLNPARGLPEQPFVGVVRSDGSQSQVFDNALIARTASANPLPLLPEASTVYALTLVHFATQSPKQSLRAYEGATRTQLVEYGALPDNLSLDTWQSESSSWRLPALLAATPPSLPFRKEIFFFQSDAPGLTRVTGFAP